MSTPEIPTPIYPGVDPDANRSVYINTLTITFTVISFLSICLRAFSRWWTKIEIGIDDYLIIVAALVSWTFSALILVEVEHNFFGQHIGKSDFEHLSRFLKIFYGGLMIYTIGLTFSKLSLLSLYLRMFKGARSVWPVYLAMAANAGWMIAIVFVSIFICHPIRGFWDVTIPSKCLPYDKIFISNESLTIALDVVVLFMPVYYISSIQRSVSQRISISSTFLLGLIATIISIIRLWRLVAVRSIERFGFDPTFDEVDPVVWGGVEVNLWVVVSSIPSFRPLVGKLFNSRKLKSSANSHTYINSSSGRVGGKYWRTGRSLGTTLASKDSHDGPEDYNVLIQGSYDTPLGDAGVKGNKVATTYELKQVPRSIRVDQEVIVSNPPTK